MRVNEVLRCVFERHNRHFVVDFGRPSVVAIFLLPMPAAAIVRVQLGKKTCCLLFYLKAGGISHQIGPK